MAELGPIDSDIIFYTTPDGVIRVEVLYQDETFWLTINRIVKCHESLSTIIWMQLLQFKLHWAITGKIAAELIAERANVNNPNRGLTNWKNAPQEKF